MKKIIAAFDGLKYSHSTRDYALQLAKITNSFLTGIFLDDFSYTSFKVYELETAEKIPRSNFQELKEKDSQTRLKASRNFEEQCSKEGIQYNVHHDKSAALSELLHEAIYADLLVVDARETLTHYSEAIPTRFIQDLLVESAGPVMVVPGPYQAIEKIILLYDGTPSSVFAIKMFSCLLPELCNLPAEILSVKGMHTNLHLPDNRLMKELIRRHFPKSVFTVLKGVAEKAVIEHLKIQRENVLVVTGAYGRGGLSRFFRNSMADHLMRSLKVPLFIAHQR